MTTSMCFTMTFSQNSGKSMRSVYTTCLYIDQVLAASKSGSEVPVQKRMITSLSVCVRPITAGASEAENVPSIVRSPSGPHNVITANPELRPSAPLL